MTTPLTDGIDPVTRASYESRSGRYSGLERAASGNEVAQIYRLPLNQAGAQQVLWTSPDERHVINGWLRKSGRLIHSSVPVDRTAQGSTRSKITTTFWLMAPLKLEGRSLWIASDRAGEFRELVELDLGGGRIDHKAYFIQPNVRGSSGYGKSFLGEYLAADQCGQDQEALFVILHKNDPRVPYPEAEQIVAKVREGGTPVQSVRRERGPWFPEEGKPGLPVLRHGAVHAAGGIEVGWP